MALGWLRLLVVSTRTRSAESTSQLSVAGLRVPAGRSTSPLEDSDVLLMLLFFVAFHAAAASRHLDALLAFLIALRRSIEVSAVEHHASDAGCEQQAVPADAAMCARQACASGCLIGPVEHAVRIRAS